jgi:hypothetical protein
MLAQLRDIGVVPTTAISTDSFGGVKTYLMNTGLQVTRKKLKEAKNFSRTLENGWAVQRDQIGNYGTNYAVRTVVAMIGLGALPPAEASYPNASVDSQGRLLSGEYRYGVRFSAGQTPPANAFWSLTMYDEQGYLINNPIERYTLGDRDALTYNEDGSLDILIGVDEPNELHSNWLPAPPGNFAITMRVYWPESDFLDGTWSPPAIERIY